MLLFFWLEMMVVFGSKLMMMMMIGFQQNFNHQLGIHHDDKIKLFSKKKKKKKQKTGNSFDSNVFTGVTYLMESSSKKNCSFRSNFVFRSNLAFRSNFRRFRKFSTKL